VKIKFVETNNVRLLARVVAALLEAQEGMPRMGLICGDVGLGKTWAVDDLVVRGGAVYVRALRGMSGAGLLRAIVRRLGERPPWSRIDCMERASSALSARAGEGGLRGLLIVDEVGYLLEGARADRFPEALDTVRDLADLAGIPVLLVGEPDVARTLKGFSASAPYRRFWDRILVCEEFKPLSAEEIKLVAGELTGLDFDPGVAELFREVTGGNLRRTILYLVRLERAARANRAARISAEMLEAVRRWAGRRKRIPAAERPVRRRVAA
jgi:DNA transposition AAA+ family ATPase